jgi:glutathione S-transferase
MLSKKEVPYETQLVSPLKIPDWILEEHDGVLPVLLHNNFSSSSPIDIARYLDETFPDVPLNRSEVHDVLEILKRTSSVYPALSEFIANVDETRENKLRNDAFSQLDMLDDFIVRTPGRYLCGYDLTWVDFFLMPQLFHASVGMKHFKKVEIFQYHYGLQKRPALETYFVNMIKMKQFRDSRVFCPIDKIIYEWKLARGEKTIPVPIEYHIQAPRINFAS